MNTNVCFTSYEVNNWFSIYQDSELQEIPRIITFYEIYRSVLNHDSILRGNRVHCTKIVQYFTRLSFFVIYLRDY